MEEKELQLETRRTPLTLISSMINFIFPILLVILTAYDGSIEIIILPTLTDSIPHKKHPTFSSRKSYFCNQDLESFLVNSKC